MRDLRRDRVSIAVDSVNYPDMDDNVIALSRRRLLREELVAAIEWLDDLDSPLRAEQSVAPFMTASERIRSARGLHAADAERTPAA
jgi:hypothetical protein